MNRKEFLQKLKENQEEDLEIVKKKNQDYASGDDPFQNFGLVEALGLASLEEAILMRVADKFQRACNVVKHGNEVEDETVIDTLSDIRNYLNILQVYLDNE